MAKKENRILNYFKEVKSELKKVVWPSFKQVKNNTLIVILCVVIIGIFIALLDAAFGVTFGNVIEKLQGGEAVEETVDGTAGDSTEMTEEEYQAAMEQMLAGVGVTVDAETGKYFDAETNAELTQEEVDARLNALLEASGLTTEGTTTETNSAE